MYLLISFLKILSKNVTKIKNYGTMDTVKDMNIEDVKKSLDRNIHLTEEVKQDLFSLIGVFDDAFGNVPLENITKNIEHLEYRFMDKYAPDYIKEKPLMYHSGTNQLWINLDKIEENDSLDYHYMKCILDMMVSDEKDPDHLLDAYHDGMSTMIASFLVGRDEHEKVSPEESLSQMIMKIVGEEAAFNIFFRNDPKVLVESLSNEGMNIDKIVPFLESWKYDRQMRDTLHESSYGKNVQMFIESFEDKLSKEKMEDVSNFFVDKEEIFEKDNVRFGNLSELGTLIEEYMKTDDIVKS